jgi:hypothetical protein
MQEAGRGLMRRAAGYGCGAQALAHTWGANIHDADQGKQYYADQSGTCRVADPNGPGDGYQLQR